MVRRVVVSVAAVVAVSVGLALPAGAHVIVSSDDATKGGFSVISFRVPNEETDADTVGLKVQLPVDHPIAYVSVQSKPGWTFTTKASKLPEPVKSDDGTVTEAISEIDWSGGKIGPGEFDQFMIQAGPLPTDTDSLTFKVIQTYRDAAGKTTDVAWIQTAAPGQPEPANPAPMLKLHPAASSGSGTVGDASGTGPQVTAAPMAAKATTRSASSDEISVFAMAFGAAGLAMAILALVVALGARQRASRRPGGSRAD